MPDILIKPKSHLLIKAERAIQQPPKSYLLLKKVEDLYKNNGYIVSHLNNFGKTYLGLSHPQKPEDIILLVKTISPDQVVSFNATRQELIKFEELGVRYNCRQYCLISPSGFEEKAQKLTSFNLLLCDESYLKELQKSSKPSKNKEPQIQLFSHNQQTYQKVKRKFRKSKSVAVVQATGTGKSYLIAKLLSDMPRGRKLVMAPSNYILDQLKEHIRWDIEAIFMTYAKSMYLTKSEIESLEVSLIVLDEFHRCGAEEWGKGVQNVLDAYTDSYVFGCSATPIRYMDNARDMSKELFNDNVAENLSLAQAIIKQILPMPKYVSALYTLDLEAETIRTRIINSKRKADVKERLLNEIDTFRIDWEKSAGIPQIFKKHLKPAMRKFIVFCKESEHLAEMEKTVVEWFINSGIGKSIITYKVHCNDPHSEKNLNAFKNADSSDSIHLLFSINMLNEGLHVKDVHGVILLRPTESPNIFYQQIGRCLKVGMNCSTIIFDLVNNFRSIRADNFMAELDFCRREEQEIRSEVGLKDNCPEFRIIDEVREITEVFGKINFQISSWDSRYEELLEYKEKYGNCNVPTPRDTKTLNQDELNLAQWVRYNRVQFKRRRLSAERIQKLNAIGFEWRLQERTDWDSQFEKLEKFKKQFGHVKVTQRWKEDPSFGKWVYRQRINYKNGSLSDEEIKKLRGIGFELSGQILPELIWDQYFEQLKQYKQNFGDCNVPINWKGSKKLGAWVSHQRKNYKIGRFLTKERKDRLEAIGFEWAIKYKIKDRWEKHFQALVSFKEEFGHTNVSNSPVASNKYKLLGTWVSLQRTNYRRGTNLPPEKIARLESIGFVWKVLDNKFHSNFNLLKTLISEPGDLKKIKDSGNKKLLTWIGNVKRGYKKGTLSADKMKLLGSIGFPK